MLTLAISWHLMLSLESVIIQATRLQVDQRVLGFANLSRLNRLYFTYHDLEDEMTVIYLRTMEHNMAAEHPDVVCMLTWESPGEGFSYW